ncbi:hypothetical protein CKO44_13205 [Rubrivivax gelatinosus]|uniref:DUF2029 domain-containing protein n=1 Tax=Rubrivivax gelatinosus TaxID=28068 RepID=A0ABS1DSU8_RUBGE|nr:hypothetical protein [Rubrivivax gelatinosus]MBK1614427.1 hypothetical protein [Rubrivivax gelatinosus]MBK1713023.1 hypothetical protein [Rubrivivax gelatinosus]MBZ8143121.1 hypothetical protein [Rubrivivax gelatinosus]
MTRALALEAFVLTLLAALAAASIPLATGYFSWSWDALNHHVYLGLVAQSPRWDLDVVAASYQGYQYPYLYWPIYRLALWTGSGAAAGALWSAFQAAMVVPPVWLIGRRLMPDAAGWQGVALRSLSCALAVASTVILIGVETSANDLLAAVPLLWAIALMLRPGAGSRSAAVAAALWGVAAAFKLSNAIYLPVLLLWWWTPHKPWFPPRRGLAIALGAALGFGLAYAPWGWQLWRLTGNPFYPFFGSWFGGA